MLLMWKVFSLAKFHLLTLFALSFRQTIDSSAYQNAWCLFLWRGLCHDSSASSKRNCILSFFKPVHLRNDRLPVDMKST